MVRLLRPELGLLQVDAAAGRRAAWCGGWSRAAASGWAAAGIDEFLRAYLTPRGRAAFYAAARNIYLDEPHGEDGLLDAAERAGAATRCSCGAGATRSCRSRS